MKSKYIKIILIITIVILCCITVMLLINPNKKISDNVQQNSYEELSEDIIIPANSYAFFGKYENGEVTSKEIYEKINFFANVTIKKYAKLANMSNEQLEEYYSRNIDEIKNDGISVNNKKEFTEFIQTVAYIEENDTIQTMSFDKDEINKNKNYTSSRLYFQYTGNKYVYLYIKVNIKKSNDMQNIVFSCNKL